MRAFTFALLALSLRIHFNVSISKAPEPSHQSAKAHVCSSNYIFEYFYRDHHPYRKCHNFCFEVQLSHQRFGIPLVQSFNYQNYNADRDILVYHLLEYLNCNELSRVYYRDIRVNYHENNRPKHDSDNHVPEHHNKDFYNTSFAHLYHDQSDNRYSGTSFSCCLNTSSFNNGNEQQPDSTIFSISTAETRQVIPGTPITSVKAGITLNKDCRPASWSTITKSFDFTQLASCHQGTYGYSFPAISVTSAASGSYFTGASTGISSVFWPPCSPIFAIPTKITNFVPAWSTCTPNAPNGWFDPTISWTPLDGEITGPNYYDYVDIFEVPQDNTSIVCISFRIDTIKYISHLIKSDSVRFPSVGDLEFRHLDKRDCVDNAQADTNLWYFFKQLEHFSACVCISNISSCPFSEHF
ncbi:hypothetical protein IWZ03DRAFT_409708 [Phyllosticta citriasiana]|uniref:Uncharacterized protein n=1 Tax=Phyllosticta citriasiana TaxID=595635 RepID=A0ABR1KBB8_9PEZI